MRALQRLEFEGMLNDPRVTDTASDFFAKPAEYAMSIFSFYMCFACRVCLFLLLLPSLLTTFIFFILFYFYFFEK
jgi:hypothetical protein